MFRLKENDGDQKYGLIYRIIHQELQTHEEVDPNILLDFWFETKDHLEKVEMNVLALENDLQNMEIIHGLLREFHTIKGLAGFVNYDLIQRIAHQIETRLDDCRKGSRQADRKVIDLILTASDYIKRFCEDPSLLRNPEYTYAIETYLKKVDIINAGMTLNAPPETHLPGTADFIPTPDAPGDTIDASKSVPANADSGADIATAINIPAMMKIDPATIIADATLLNNTMESINASDKAPLGIGDSVNGAFEEGSVFTEGDAITEDEASPETGVLAEAGILSESSAFTEGEAPITDNTPFAETDAFAEGNVFVEDGALKDETAAFAAVYPQVEQIQIPDEKTSFMTEKEAEYLKVFIDETQNYLDLFEQTLMQFEKEPDNNGMVNELFRSMHTIKGMASAMGFVNVTALSHGIENILQDIRDHQLTASPQLIGVLFLGHDHINDSLQSIIITGAEGELKKDGYLDQLREILPELKKEQTNSGTLETNFAPEAEVAPDVSANSNANSNSRLAPHPELGIDPDFLQETMAGIMEWVTKIEIKLLLLETFSSNSALILSIRDHFQIVNRLAHLALAEQTQNIARHSAVLLKKCAAGELPMTRPVIDWLLQSTDFLKKLGGNFELNEDQNIGAAVTGHLNQFPANTLEIADVDREALDGTPVQKLGDILIEQEKLTLSEVTELLARQKADVPELRLGQIGVREGKIEPEELRESLKIQQETMINLEPADRPGADQDSGNDDDPFAVFRQMYGLETAPAKPVQKIGEIMVSRNIISQDEMDGLLVQQKEVHPKLKLGQVAVAEKKAQPKEIIQSLRAQEHEFKTLSAENDNVRVSISKVDNLVDMVGELLIIQSLIEQEAGQRFGSNDYFMTNLVRMARITKDIQNMSMSLQMISLKSTFQKLNRVARDAITQLGKNISFQMIGEETEIDRGVAEKILDPLIHLVKNAVSHGIESESTRASLGKPAQGLVRVEASSKRGYIFIDISDDGNGMDINAIRNKALEKNLIEPGASYTTDEIFNLVFLPGFSTAEFIDNISGRGVGLDVVKTEMQKIGGKVEIISQPGQGSTFTLKIPINFAVFNGIIISIEATNFILPTQSVRRIVQIKPDQWVQDKGKKMITLRDEVYPVIPIFKALGLISPESANLVLILELDGKSKALPVHGIVGKREIVLKPLGNEFSNLLWIAGTSILGDGKVSLILDVENIFKMMEEDVR